METRKVLIIPLFAIYCYFDLYSLINVVKTWKKRSDEPKDNHLYLFCNTPPAISTISSTRFRCMLVLAYPIYVVTLLILILASRLSLCQNK